MEQKATMCVQCGEKIGTVSIIDLEHPSKVEGDTTIYGGETTMHCLQCAINKLCKRKVGDENAD